MAKTAAPLTFEIPVVGQVTANAVPDPFDARDFEYRPRLQLLPTRLDQRDSKVPPYVMLQAGESCTGHAIATVVNTVLAHVDQPRTGQALLYPVSPYMLYRLGRRYDEFQGEADAGSSLRGVLKGWFNHGVSLLDDWPNLNQNPEPDLDDPTFQQKCRPRPLGAFYRVNPFRLDDMQSAISELHAIAVSAAIHNGWVNLTKLTRGDETVMAIAPTVNKVSRGGHAFALVGYNEVGFLVHNSWGKDWGKGGFATLPYEDWLDSAYDAWVVRPGVPQTPFASGRSATVPVTGGGVATGDGPDLGRLAMHVVDIGNDGKLSTAGKFCSTPAQINRAFDHMELWHSCWLQQSLTGKRHVVLYAHGGLTSEASGLATAQTHLNWWLNNQIYPIYFIWQSGAAETLMDQLVNGVKGKLPIGGLGFDLVEQFDRLVELFAASNLRWAWDTMKQNAGAASAPIDPADLAAGPVSASSAPAFSEAPGASLTIRRLAEYVADQGPDQISLHLVGHSAGAIFAAALLDRLAEAGLKVDSLALLAPAIRVDRFREAMLPRLGVDQLVARFATFDLTGARELQDVCGAGVGPAYVEVYHKSLLYLVSRAFERAALGEFGEVPLLGLEKFLDAPPADGTVKTLNQVIADAGGLCIFSPTDASVGLPSQATSHGGFHEDPATMTSVVLHALELDRLPNGRTYQPNSALDPVAGAPSLDGFGAKSPVQPPGGDQPAAVVAETRPPGATPVEVLAEPQLARPVAPTDAASPGVEKAVAPRSGKPIVDALEQQGWERVIPLEPAVPAD